MIDPSPPRLFARLGAWQARKPFLLIAIALLSLIPAGFFTSQLGFKPSFAELLPDDKDSVIEMRRVSKRLPGITALTVTAQIDDGGNEQALREFVDALVPRLEALGPPEVERVDWGVHETRRFLDQNRLLFAKLDNLRKTRDELSRRYEYEVQKQSGWLLDEDDPPPPITADDLREQLLGEKKTTKKGGKTKALKRRAPGEKPGMHENGYFMSKDGRFVAVIARTSVSGKAARTAFRSKVEAIVAELKPKRFDPSMQVGYTGDLIISGEQYDAIVQDLGEVGLGGVLGVLASVLFFFLRVRTVLVMGASLLVGLSWTFAITRFSIGYLNSSTGFLVSIIAGNGINYGIIYMARYIEARRDEGASVADAIAIAHRDSWLPTLAAAATAMLAYGSLIVTDFRGFKHFGIIGAYGMMLCWLATFLFTPALLAASERWRPMTTSGAGRSKRRGYYGVIFSRLAHAAPRAVLLCGLVITTLSAVMAFRYFSTDPMEYDMKNIRSKSGVRSTAYSLSLRVGKIVGRMSQDGMAVMTDRLDQVPLLTKALEERFDAAPKDKKPFQKVVTIYSLLPKEQAEKIPIIEELLKLLDKAHRRGFIKQKEWDEIAPYIPEGKLKPVGLADLPEPVARPFIEKNGDRGHIVYIVPRTGESVWDARYLIRWADSFRSTTLPNGEVIKGSGRAVIYADMIQSVVEDAPKAVILAAVGAILVLLLAFRFRRLALGVFFPWLAGLTMLIAFLQWQGIKLNFLNFIALPITVGIGAEYAHNLMQRYRTERGENLDRVISETGGAVVLCSLTTAIGYFALMWSVNRGIASFGMAAAVGELVCVLSAVLFLPSYWVWMKRRRDAAQTTTASPE